MTLATRGGEQATQERSWFRLEQVSMATCIFCYNLADRGACKHSWTSVCMWENNIEHLAYMYTPQAAATRCSQPVSHNYACFLLAVDISIRLPAIMGCFSRLTLTSVRKKETLLFWKGKSRIQEDENPFPDPRNTVRPEAGLKFWELKRI